MKTSTVTKTTIALALLISQLSQPVAMAMTNTFAASDAAIGLTIRTAVDNVQKKKLSSDEASQQFAQDMAGFTSTEITHYLYTNGSESDREVFKQTLEAGDRFTDRDTLVEALNQISRNQPVKSGSHFKMSCGAVLGIGLPVALAGLAVSVIGLVNSKNTSSQIQKDYEKQVQKASEEYSSTTTTLQTQYQQTFTKEESIKALRKYAEDQIKAGHLTDGNGNKYCDLIKTYDQQTSDIYTTRTTILTQITTTKTTYDTTITTLNESEKVSIKEATDKAASGKSLAVIGAIPAGAGLAFLAVGLSSCGGGGKAKEHTTRD